MTKAEELEMLEEFERFRVALHAVGASTDGLYVQTAQSAAIGVPRGVRYRVGQHGVGGVNGYPLGEELNYRGQFMEMLRVACRVLAMVPDDETPA